MTMYKSKEQRVQCQNYTTGMEIAQKIIKSLTFIFCLDLVNLKFLLNVKTFQTVQLYALEKIFFKKNKSYLIFRILEIWVRIF